MNRSETTPIGQSAIAAGQARPRPTPGGPTTADGRRVPDRAAEAGTPVEGATPVGETVQSAPPVAPVADPAVAIRQRRVNAGNLQVLARQAIGMGYSTMTCDPRIVADFCAEYDRLSSLNPAPAPGSEQVRESAQEEGRRAAMAEFAEERAELLKRISGLESQEASEKQDGLTPPPPLTPDTNSEEDGDFRGPGQQG